MQILDISVAVPGATMTRDAYREFCWGANLEETTAGYGLIRGGDLDGSLSTWILNDIEYTQLIQDATRTGDGTITIAADKVHKVIDDWPCLRSDAPSVW